MWEKPLINHLFNKKLISYMLLALALVLGSGCTFRSQLDKSPQAVSAPDLSSSVSLDAIFNPSRQWAFENSDLPPDPGVVYKTMPNGFRFILMKNKRPENRVSMHLFVQAGSMEETDSEQGLAHFLEHMQFNGSTHFKSGDLVKYFQEIGMQFGADANANTGFYSTAYDIDLPKGDRDGLEKGLLVLRDYADGALIQEKEVDQERGVILAEKRTRDSVDYRTFEAAFHFELPDALLSKRLPIGKEKIIRSAGRRLIKSFYDTWYRPERMVLVMAGDFDIPTAIAVINEKFATLTSHGEKIIYQNPGSIHHQGIQPFYHFEPEAGNASITIETIVPKINPPDSAALERRRLMSEMANYIINNRLSELLEKSDTPFTSATISSGDYLNYVEGADISAECPPARWKDTLAIMEQTLRKALTYGFTAPEIDRAKKTFLSGLDQGIKTAPTRESGNLAGQIMHDLANRRVFQSPEQRKALLAPVINTVSQAELRQALKEDWAANHRLILVTGNANLNAADVTPENQILQAWNESRRVKVEKPTEKASIGFPYLPAPAGKSEILRQETIPGLGIVSIQFKNQVRLLIKKTKFKDNQIQAALIFGAGQRSEPEKTPGLGLLTERVVNLSGLGRMNRDDLKQALAGKNTSVAFQVEEDDFALSGVTVPDEIALLFQLYQAYLTDPGFRKDALDLAVAQYAQEYDAMSHSIEGGMMIKGARFLAGGDSRFGLPDIGVIKKYSLDDIRNWVMPALNSQPIEISVVGDMDVNKVIDLAARYLGALPPRTGAIPPDQGASPAFPKGRSLTVTMPTVISKGIVDVAYPTGDFRDNWRNRRLSALAEVITDRMRVKIREEMGAAYSSDAYNAPSRAYKDYGILHSVVETDPSQSDVIIKAIKAINANIVKNGVRTGELERAIKPILTTIRERIKTNSYWLDNVMKGSSRFPAQLDWSRTFEADYASITTKELDALAKQYLNNADAATVIISPAPKSGDGLKK